MYALAHACFAEKDERRIMLQHYYTTCCTLSLSNTYAASQFKRSPHYGPHMA